MSEVRVPEGSPPPSLNALMKVMLRTPGLQRWVGKGVALLTFTGRRSGKRFTIPVSYDRQEDTVIMLTQQHRTWWRNFQSPSEVELRLAGREVRGVAQSSVGDETSLPQLIAFLQHRSTDARALGVRSDDAGRIEPNDARRLLDQVVIVRVALH